jgi:hypothetical protein
MRLSRFDLWIKGIAAVVLLVAVWSLAVLGQRFNACRSELRDDNAKLDAIDGVMAAHLTKLATLLRRGPLEPAAHEIDRLANIDDPTPAAFEILGRWIDPSVPVPSWTGNDTPVPADLPPVVLYRLKLTEFSAIWLQAQIIAVHLAMRNDPDTELAHNHQLVLMKELQWLDAVINRSPKPTLSTLHCIRG